MPARREPPAAPPRTNAKEDGRPPQEEMLLTAAGIFVIVALVIFFAVEMTNPDSYVLQDRTIYILLALIAALLGFNQFQSPLGGHYGGSEGRGRNER